MMHPDRAETSMRTNIDIDDALMAEAPKVTGYATKRRTVEEAPRLMVKRRRQRDVGTAFGKYRRRGNLARSRKGDGAD
jgi:Arc/MetJ family transcription regulator